MKPQSKRSKIFDVIYFIGLIMLFAYWLTH